MKRPRPHIPIPIRIKVARRQLFFFGASDALMQKDRCETPAVYLSRLLSGLALYFGDLFQPCHLDHDPPLRTRAFNPRTGKYKPDANDPRYLVYRSKEGHRVKTYVRGEHGQYSDTILIARERKREKKKAGLMPAYHWPKRKIRNRKNAVHSGKSR